MTEPVNQEAGTPPPPPTSPGWSKMLLVVTGLVGLAALSYLGVREALRARLAADGTVAPTLKLKKYEEKNGPLALTDLRGKVVMLDFWATWCAPCQAEMPALLKLAKEYESQGLVFVAASRDEMPDAPLFVQEFVQSRMPELAPYVVFAPDELAALYQVQALPTLFFLDRKGSVVDAHRGMLSEAALRQRIERALK